MSERTQISQTKFMINYLENKYEESAQITIIPNTGDSIILSYILLGVSVTDLIICFALEKRKPNKIITVILLAAIVTPVAKAAFNTYSFVFNSDYKIYDKQVTKYIVGGEEKEIITLYGEF